ncbi:acetyltransferase-like isoleucine patch superfamily enzyme [Bradyrhizobium elkanii]|uniref:acyltransferase n=1 Tax=Bradyrhizobium elkanii TaxID=29448 RepID=UPI0009BE851E|nr:acyltransferase [Bradyrhizobium elkanii]
MDKFEDLLQALLRRLRTNVRAKFNRRVSTGDLLSDRWENARECGFGEGTSCYDNVLVLGDVRVGCHCWIGPNVILDGSGGLVIGDYCSISAGVQIYSHHTVAWANSLGSSPIDRRSTRIGSGVYIGPNTVIEMGSEIGDRAVIGAMSLVRSNIPSKARAWGVPARVVAIGNEAAPGAENV